MGISGCLEQKLGGEGEALVAVGRISNTDAQVGSNFRRHKESQAGIECKGGILRVFTASGASIFLLVAADYPREAVSGEVPIEV